MSRTMDSAFLGTKRTSRAPAITDIIITVRPAVNDPDFVVRYPTKYGPTKPAVLPTALIIPTDAAAADLLRSSVGIEKKTGRYAPPAVTIVRDSTISGIERGCIISPKNPTVDISIGTEQCQRLSRHLSECHPLTTIAKKYVRYGNAPSRPTFASESPEKRFSIDGNQNNML